jgi:cyclophilin family peptidyl-prolyl cis-trans isomerase
MSGGTAKAAKWIAGLLLIATVGAPSMAVAQPSGPPPETATAPASVPESSSAPAPVPAADPENILNLDLSTGGRVSIQLRPDKAPLSVERLKTLTRQGFYDNTTFHRVIEGFMAQGGDPQGTGEGGSKLPDLKAEFNDLPHLRGTLSMARADSPDSANSQFFITFAPVFQLDGKYTAVGRVISGMQYVDAINRGEPPERPSRIIKASIEADKVPPPPSAALAADEPAGMDAAAAAAATLFRSPPAADAGPGQAGPGGAAAPAADAASAPAPAPPQ